MRLLTTSEGTFEVARSGLARDRRRRRADPPRDVRVRVRRNTGSRPAPTELRVPLTWTDGQGLVVTKTYVFKRGSYEIDLSYDVTNGTPADWKAASYVQFVRHVYSQKRSMFDVESYAYRGPAIYDGKKYRKLDVERRGGLEALRVVRGRLDGGDAASLRERGRPAGHGDLRLHAWHSRARIPCSASADR